MTVVRAGSALIALPGKELSPADRERLADPRVAGVTLYRSLNIDTPGQTRALTDQIREAMGRPGLIAIDQEGGQLIGAGAGTTQFAGNMALGAAGSTELTRRVYRAMGIELLELGINVNYAPVADVASRPGNPSLGIRSFGEDPSLVAAHTVAAIEGLQGAGVAATVKHFPGKGEATVDPHHGLPVLDLDRARLDQVEFMPFRAAIEAGVKLLMVGHYGLPAIVGDRTTPTSVSSAAIRGLIRDELGFAGVIVTDALDMGGFGGYPAEAPLAAGANLLLYGPAQIGQLPAGEPSNGIHVADLLSWVYGYKAEPGPIPTDAQLAAELAARATTLIRDQAGLLPLRLDSSDRILCVMPRPIDLTPADTSSLVIPSLASAVSERHGQATEILTSHTPDSDEVREVVDAAAGHQLILVGTIDANPEQARLVDALHRASDRVVTVALRTPYDLALYPSAPVHLATYGLHRPSMDALVAVLFGEASPVGRLPVSIPSSSALS